MSVKIERIIDKLKKTQAEWADGILRGKGSGRDSYEFGRACGTYQGLLKAEEIINEIIGEPDDKNGGKLDT